jgi:uncharacterized cupin superfamily protein
MPKLDLDAIPQVNTTGYPAPFDKDVAGRWVRRLRPAAGLDKLGAAHVVLKPGAWSSQRHWHAVEDELVVILSGECVLVEDGGETVLRAGDTSKDWGEYPDIDLVFRDRDYFHKDGTPYPPKG